MRKSHVLLAVFAIILALTAVFAQPNQYDLENFEAQDSSLVAGAGAGVLVGLKVGAANPTLGSEGLIAFEFTTGTEITTAFSILNILPGFCATPRLLARITTVVAGGVGHQGKWIGAAALLGTSIDSSFVPSGDSLKLFIPVTFTIAAQTTVRIEITGAQAPLTFGFVSAACRSVLASLPSTNLLVQNDECCASFSAFLVAGVGAGVALPPLGLQLGASFIVYAKVTATICPNFGSDNDDCEPEVCLVAENLWTPSVRKLCCQYSRHRPKPYCDIIVCVEEERSGPFNHERCCHVKGLLDLHEKCELCDPGNFPLSICCDGFNNSTRMQWRREDPRCDPVVCACEEWDSPRCCHHHYDSPYYDTRKCPSCEVQWNRERCCLLNEYKYHKKCLCDDDDDYLGPWCCQDNETFNNGRCEGPTSPCEDCQCEAEGEEDISCPCALLNGTETGNSIVKYSSHEMNAENIRSGHNTVLINHLHIDVDAENAEDLQTLIQLSLQSGGEGSLLSQIRDQIRDDVTTIVGDVKDKISHINNTLAEIAEPIKHVVDETVGRPVRQILRILRKNPLNALELTTLRILFNAQLILQASSKKYNIRWSNQYPFGSGGSTKSADVSAAATSGEGNVLVADISEPETSQEKMTTILNAASPNIITNAAKAFGADISVDSTLAVAGSNECPANSCSASCQCEAHYACQDNSECLSNICDSKKKVCVDNSSTSSAFFRQYSSYLLALLVIVASLAILRVNH